MIGKKITVLQDLHGEKTQFIFDCRRLFKGIFRAIDDMVGLEGLQREDFKTAIKNTIHTFVRKFDKVKPENKRPEVPSPQNAKYHPNKFEKEGLNYHLNQKSLNYPELLSPFMLTS